MTFDKARMKELKAEQAVLINAAKSAILNTMQELDALMADVDSDFGPGWNAECLSFREILEQASMRLKRNNLVGDQSTLASVADMFRQHCT